MTAAALGILFPAFLIAAAIDDLRRYRISNVITALLALAFVPAALAGGFTAAQIGFALAVGLLVLAIGFGLFSAGWLGGGDAKLIAASILWTGASAGGAFLFTTVLCGGVLALVFLLYRRLPVPAALEGRGWVMALHDRDRGIPYGVAICAAGLIVWPQTAFYVF